MSRVRQEAARWFARMRDAAPDHPDRGRFETWLAAHPAHAQEYQAFAGLWKELDPSTDCNDLADAMERQQQRRRLSRRRLVKGGVLGLFVAGSVGETVRYAYWNKAMWRLSARTGIGELRTESLRDGSTVILGPDTDLDIVFSRAERKVRLREGEAIFEVEKDAEHPFVVDSGAARITVLGTRFAVERLTDDVRVSVDHGRVGVASGPFWDRQYIVLGDGQVAGVSLSGSEAGQLRSLDRNATDAFAFQRGIIVFDRASLSEIAETLSRYRRLPVRAVPGHAEPRITAVVQAADVESFLRLLPRMVPVAVKDDGGTVTLTPR